MALIRIASILCVFVLQSFAHYTACAEQTLSVADSANGTHYDIRADLLPKAGSLDVSLDMQFAAPEQTDSLQFLLHGDLDLQTLQSSHIESYNVEEGYNPYGFDTSHVQLVTVKLKRSVAAGAAVPLHWEYGGTYENEHFQLGPSAFRPHWVELEVGSLWIPIAASLKHRFTFDMRATLPQEYDVVSTGTIQRSGKTWTIHATEPQIGAPLLASDQMQSMRTETRGMRLGVYHTGESDTLVSFVAENARRTMRFYQELFEAKESADVLRVVIPPPTRARAQAYARPHLIVLTHGAESDEETFAFIAHEAAHLWWSNAADAQSQHNFLNEAFAEYASYLVMREVYGEEAYQKRIAQARKEAQGLPSISAWTPQLNDALTRSKGPYLLHQLCERVERGPFEDFMRALLTQETDTVGDMLRVLEDMTGRETAAWFGEKL